MYVELYDVGRCEHSGHCERLLCLVQLELDDAVPKVPGPQWRGIRATVGIAGHTVDKRAVTSQPRTRLPDATLIAIWRIAIRSEELE